jgi:nucleotide-binding universal stress UspA family protein
MIQDPSSSNDSRYVILAVLTFNTSGMQALLEATRLSQLHPNSELHVVHIAPEALDAGPRRRASSVRPLQLTPVELEEYVRQACAQAPSRVVAHVRVGVPSRAIVRTAAEINAELVVVGDHRNTRVRKLARGSIAEQVYRHAHCPVFIALPKDHTSKPVASQRETACPRCLDARQRTFGEQSWCEKHERAQAKLNQVNAALQLPDRMHYHP